MNEGRKEVLQIVFVLVGLIFLVKLFFIQIVEERYKNMAGVNAIRKEIQYPIRGIIKDRNGKLIVYNSPEFDLMVILHEVKHFDSTRFCQVFGKTQDELRLLFKSFYTEIRNRKANRFQPFPFLRQLSTYDLARIQDNLDEFPGFFIQDRTTRAYASKAVANAIGYVSEISKNQLDRDKTGIYKQGDYIGQSGIESFYEEYLRGQRGIKHLMRNKDGVIKGSYEGGKYDTLSVPGQDLVSTIDLTLQEYGAFLLNGKSGSIIAIEPATG
jgi:penicillin-binding protein 2